MSNLTMFSKPTSWITELWEKNNLLNKLIYVITFFYLFYIFYICYLSVPNTHSIGNVGIDLKLIDLGGFGSFLSGIFSPLAFLWLILNFRQQNKSIGIAEKQLEMIIQEKNNKMIVSKAIFTLGKCELDQRFSTSNPDLIHFSFSLTSNIKLTNCSFSPLSDDSAFQLTTRLTKQSTYLSSSTKKTILADEKVRIALLLNLKEKPEYGIFEDIIYVHYIDQEGNEQTNRIHIMNAYDVELATNNNSYFGTFIALPK